MRKDQVLQIAVKKNIRKKQIGEECDTSLSIVEQCIREIAIEELSEKEKKEKLIKLMQSFLKGKSRYIAGCKREQMCAIAKYIFGIGNATSKIIDRELSNFDFKELYLYYCYVERIIKGGNYFSDILLEDYNKSVENQRKRAELKKAEEQRKKEEQEKEEMKRIENMDEKERWKLDIFNKEMDMVYFYNLEKNKYDEKNKLEIAKLLKEYWSQKGKWEQNKVSKKQIKKISKVKEILGEDAT